MKKCLFRSLLLASLLTTTLFVAVACQASGPPPSVAELEPSVAEPELSVVEPEPSVVDEVAIQWQEPALEALVREKLDKPQGDIFPSDLDSIRRVELFGATHIFFNVERNYSMPIMNASQYANDKGIEIFYHYRESTGKLTNKALPIHLLKMDGSYEIDGQLYTRGSISSLADFANFRNLEYLIVHKNNLQDLAGLSSLEKLEWLHIQDCAVQNVEGLAGLQHVEYLNLAVNQISDISPLGNLSQLSRLTLNYNRINSLDGIATLTNLLQLGFSYNPIIINNYDTIKDMEKLAMLSFDGTKIDDISALADITTLQGLNMSNLETEQIDLAPLAGLKKLSLLRISQDKAELLNIRTLGEIETLQFLEILQEVNISTEDMAWLSEQLPFCQITDNFYETR
jgi:internalin A